MPITADQTRRVQAVEHPVLTRFKNEFGTKTDLSRYEKIRCNERETSPEVVFLNQLQMDCFIPTQIALLLKSNLHDIPFITHTTRSILYQLKHDEKIGDRCFTFLHEKINKQHFFSVFKYLYILMLYSKVAEAHDAQVCDAAFRFESTACYSDKLVKTPPHLVEKEEISLQEKRRKHFLKTYLTQIAARPGLPHEISQAVVAAKSALGHHNPQQFRIHFMAMLKKLEGSSSELEKICWKELQVNISPFQGQEFFDQTYLRLKTENYYNHCLSSVRILRQSLEMTNDGDLLTLGRKCKKAYNGCIYLLGDSKNMAACSPMRFAALVGKMRTEWQAINSAFNRAQGNHAHSLCACQVQTPPSQNELATWPFNTHPLVDLKPATPPTQEQILQRGMTPAAFVENKKKTVAIMGCKWGGGHMEVSRGIADKLASVGYHPITVNLPEVLKSEDPIRNAFLTRWLGKDWSIAALFESLLTDKAFAFINFLRWAQSKLFSVFGYSENELKLVMEELLKLNPDSVITTYSAHNEPVIQACKILGIPCIHISTDIDTTIETRKKPVDFKHFKMGIPFAAPETINPILNTTTPEQRFVCGPPVRHSFTERRTAEDVQNFKQKWSIETNKKVVIISNGKNGAFSPYAELLAKKYANASRKDIPIHLVVICGKDNHDFKRHLEQNVSLKTKLPMTIGLHYNEKEMEQLMSMASYGGLLIGKAGGGTIFETFARGIRILIDDVRSGWFSGGLRHFFVRALETFLKKLGFQQQLSWEKVNMNFAKRHGLATSFKAEKEFLPKLEQMLSNNGLPVTLNIEIKNVEEEIPKVLRQMWIKAQFDLETLRAREAHRNL
jgi:UDP-N-acetylglucosamine:LPS N-acetylglucosamine transferase